MLHWAIAKVKPPQGEQQFLRWLVGHEIEEHAYVFMMHRTIRPRHGNRKIVTVSRPLFPGYVFLKMCDKRCFLAHQSAGFSYWLQNSSKQIAVIADETMELLKEQLGDMVEKTDLCKLREMSVPGTRVRIKHGLWEGRTGIIDKLLDKDCVRIAIGDKRLVLPLAMHGELVYSVESGRAGWNIQTA